MRFLVPTEQHRFCLSITIEDLHPTHLLPSPDDRFVQWLASSDAVLESSWWVGFEVCLAFLQDELAVSCGRSTESGDWKFMDRLEKANGAERPPVIDNEEGRTTVPGAEEGPSCLTPPLLRQVPVKLSWFELKPVLASKRVRCEVDLASYQKMRCMGAT